MRNAASELKKTLAELNFDEQHAIQLSAEDRLRYLGKVLQPHYIGCGRHRYVYGVNGHYVVKVPVSTKYTAINTAEWNVFRRRQKAGSKWSKELPEPAKCCVVTVAGQKLLIMERLKNVRTPDNKKQVPKDWPPWVHWLDCCQCGESSEGKIVAFDYGTDTSLFR